MNEKLLNKIINAAYGSAGITDRLVVWLNVKKNSEAEKIFNEYKKTASAVKTLKQAQCPEAIVNKALAEAELSKKRKHSINLSRVFFTKGFAFGSIVALVIAVTTALYLNKKENTEEVYTEEQIELAEKQTKEALALVGKVLNNSKTILKNEVLYKQVSKPINVSIRTVNYLFKKGDKNESIN